MIIFRQSWCFIHAGGINSIGPVVDNGCKLEIAPIGMAMTKYTTTGCSHASDRHIFERSNTALIFCIYKSGNMLRYHYLASYFFIDVFAKTWKELVAQRRTTAALIFVKEIVLGLLFGSFEQLVWRDFDGQRFSSSHSPILAGWLPSPFQASQVLSCTWPSLIDPVWDHFRRFDSLV